MIRKHRSCDQWAGFKGRVSHRGCLQEILSVVSLVCYNVLWQSSVRMTAADVRLRSLQQKPKTHSNCQHMFTTQTDALFVLDFSIYFLYKYQTFGLTVSVCAASHLCLILEGFSWLWSLWLLNSSRSLSGPLELTWLCGVFIRTSKSDTVSKSFRSLFGEKKLPLADSIPPGDLPNVSEHSTGMLRR